MQTWATKQRDIILVSHAFLLFCFLDFLTRINDTRCATLRPEIKLLTEEVINKQEKIGRIVRVLQHVDWNLEVAMEKDPERSRTMMPSKYQCRSIIPAIPSRQQNLMTLGVNNNGLA